MRMPDYIAYGKDWAEEEKYPIEQSLLLVSRKTDIDTARIFRCLCGALPVEKVDRREEVDVYGWQKTLVLARLSVPVSDLNIAERININDGTKDIDMKTIILKTNTAAPQSVTPPPAIPKSAPQPAILNTTTTTQLDLSRLSLGSNYRKLRTFSGHAEKGKDEDQYQVWRAQAKALIEESEVSLSEKRRRLREALRSPALDIIDDLKKEKPSATAKDYLDALEIVFGTTLSGEELFHQFVSLDQRPGEKPSDYLSRLQASLRQVAQKGGITPDKTSQALLKQFLKGTLFDQLLLVDLHLRDQVDNAPTYLTLLGQVRRWEEECQGKSKKAKAIGARNAQVAKVEATSNSERKAEAGLAERLGRIEQLIMRSPIIVQSFQH